MELIGGCYPARLTGIAGEIELLFVSDCLQFAVAHNQLSLDSLFSSGANAKF